MQRLHRSEDHPILSAADLFLSFISHITDSLLLKKCNQRVLVRTEQNLTLLETNTSQSQPQSKGTGS